MNESDPQDVHSDDQFVLNFVLQHVRGLRPVSTTDELQLDEEVTFS